MFTFSRMQIVHFVDNWLLRHFPLVRRWQYDDNSGERSINLFHVHVFVEMMPYCFHPREGMEYFPPHTLPPLPPLPLSPTDETTLAGEERKEMELEMEAEEKDTKNDNKCEYDAFQADENKLTVQQQQLEWKVIVRHNDDDDDNHDDDQTSRWCYSRNHQFDEHCEQ